MINMIPGKNNGISLLESEKQLTSLTNEVKRSNKPQISEDMLSLGRLGIQKRKAVPIDKKRKSVQIEQYGKVLVSPTHKRRRSLHIPRDRLEELVESSPSEQETSAKQSVEKGFGLQKSAQMGVSKSFSLSCRSGGVSSNEELPESGNPNSSDSNKEKHFMDVSKDGNLDGESSQLKERVALSKAQAARQDLDPNKAARGASWLQKSSWTQLVGNGNGTSFSISQILSGTNFEKPNVEEPDGINSNHLDFVKGKIIDMGTDGCQVLYPQKEVLLTAAPTFDVAFPYENKLNPSQSDKRHGQEHERMDEVSCCDEPSASTSRKICNYGPMKMADATPEISGSCPFMRSAASVKEWTSAKAALSGSL
ncbi:hypothetical protein Nepgr_001087 [Nepenthes gracilis]|uniref:Uncharacterized protein n=1 Tax=Nepenthes gracilis TaxID=150966 RepID=A0AAD3P4K5_NEPGR|nr:hypothetical protein Nepgr_001087 [Nepenthes gracilis]